MKLLEALQKVDKTHVNDWFDTEELCSICGIVGVEIDVQLLYTRMKSYWVYNWCCTDTLVGITALYLDDKLVGTTSRLARKSRENIKFVGKAEFDAVVAFVRSCCIANDPDDVDLVTDTDEIDEWCSHYFASQLQWERGSAGKVDERACTIVSIDRTNDWKSTLTVMYDDDGSTETLGVDEIKRFSTRIYITTGE